MDSKKLTPEIPGVREINESRCTIQISWDDVPHLTEQAKEEMRRATPPHLLGARETGIPSLGSGAIYPIPISEIRVDPFKIPDYWPRLYALDVGWRRTAALWIAWDRDDDVVYAYSEHYKGHVNPSVHAHAIKARGEWIPGVIDPAARQRSQRDGERIMDEYTSFGLELYPAKNTVESGLYRCLEMFMQGRLKVFSSLTHFLDEYKFYRRDDEGKIVKSNDHLMDALRYLAHSYEIHARVKPIEVEDRKRYIPGIAQIGY